MPPIRILVVDDSLVIRKVVSEALKSDPAFEVAGTAGAGRMALIRIPTLQGRANIFVSKAHGLALGFIEGDSVLVRQLHSLGKFFGKGQPDAAIVPQSCA